MKNPQMLRVHTSRTPRRFFLTAPFRLPCASREERGTEVELSPPGWREGGATTVRVVTPPGSAVTWTPHQARLGGWCELRCRRPGIPRGSSPTVSHAWCRTRGYSGLTRSR